MQTLQVTSELIGKYINYYGWSDIEPRGKIIGVRGKSILIIQKVSCERDETFKLIFHAGGFSAHCENQSQQRWIFSEETETFELRLSHSFLRNNRIEDAPRKFYDYNF